MRLSIGKAAALALMAATPATAQSAAELRAQYQQTMEMLNQAESMGVDPSMLASLRESLEGLRESIEEQERSEREAASQPVEEPIMETNPSPVAASSAYEPNLAADTCGDFGITESNFRTAALAPGNDKQMKNLCGQAMEFYSMYKRAVDQKHPEAYRTYDAHKAAAMQLNGYDRDTGAASGEGIQPDTRTAAAAAAERRADQSRAEAEAASVPRPPQAPPCRGCVSPQ